MDIADRVRSRREALGWSKLELARRAGISRVTVQNVEGRVGKPDMDTLQKIASAMATPVSELIGAEPLRLGRTERLARWLEIAPEDTRALVFQVAEMAGFGIAMRSAAS